ncbi:MAG: hypothetical protein F6K14_05285 [Symploca sp. SIO2C1]|nr:hypothetical protein [Symploca sp. SIO2C1]
MNKNINFLKLGLYFITIIVVVVYVFIIFLPLPAGIGVGLDPSWTYGISRAAVDQLIFGQDIIFTYGPFGYLIQGAALEQNFFAIAFFQIGVHLAFLGVTVAKLLQLKTNLQKLALAISVLLIYLINFTTDYRIIFTFLLLLSWNNILNRKLIRCWSLGLGAVAGFCLLTKFTVGVSTIGALVLLLLANLYNSLRAKSAVETSILALVDSMIAATSVAFLFLNPEPLFSFHKLLICAAIAGAFGATTWFIQHLQRRKQLSQVTAEAPTTKFNNWKLQLIGWQGFYWVYSVSLLITVLSAKPSLLAFIKTSLEVSSGYSSAMSIVASPWEVGCAALGVVIVLALLRILAQQNSLGFSLSLAFVLWITFKHGFVRQDAHVLIFVFSLPLIVALIIAKSQSLRLAKFAYIVQAYALLMIIVYCFVPEPFGQALTLNHIFNILKPNPTTIVSKVSSLLNLNQVKEQTIAASFNNLAAIKLPDKVTTMLKDKQIDVVPIETSLVAANNLNWKPRPLFQSYVAYKTSLDNANLKSLVTQPRDYLIYQFITIDGKHPFFDEPATFFHMMCHYQLSPTIPGFVQNTPPAIAQLMILEQRQSNICPTGLGEEKITIPWKAVQELTTRDGSLARAAVKIKYSLFGKIYKTLFRSPPVQMKVTYEDGFEKGYRIIPENADNGIVISHLPKDANEALSFFQALDFANRQLTGKVKSISFSNQNSLLYSSNIELTFTSYNMLAKTLN